MRYCTMVAGLALLLPGVGVGMSRIGGESSVAVRSLDHGGYCGSERRGAVWLDDAKAVAAFARQDDNRLNRSAVQDVDFGERAVVVVSMGTQPTGGYVVRLEAGASRLSDGVLTVAVEWHQPGAAAITTQALTQPCLVVSVPRGRYKELVFVDKAGKAAIRLAR